MEQILPYERQNEFNKQELLNFKEAEKRDPHFDNIDVTELTEDDLIMYARFKDGVVTEKELRDHLHEVAKWTKDNNKDMIRSSRISFIAYLINKFTVREFEKILAKKSETTH